MWATWFLLAALLSIGTGAIALWFLRDQGPTMAVRRWSEYSSWLALSFGLGFALQIFANPAPEIVGWLYFDELQGLLVPYILLMGVLAKRFAYHSLQTNPKYARFFLKIKLLIATLLLFVVLNHVIPLALTWVASGWVMVGLIAHTDTKEARNSARLARQRFLIGDCLMLAGLGTLVTLSGSFNLTDWFPILSSQGFSMAQNSGGSILLTLALVAIALGAFSKTAQIPFQRWLPHTLAAPTPVSAIMHAGFVNSGAILLAKISPLVVREPAVMTLLFAGGLLSAVWGSVAMLAQTDVKRYLTFSTIGQMGFMMMECGLGAFHLAILHLMVHGFFKGRMFLSVGRVMEHRPAIRNVQAQQQAQSYASTPLFVSLKLGSAVFLAMLATGWIVWQMPPLQKALLELPPILLVTLALSILFTQTILIKIKGARMKGLGVAFLFSLALISLYVVYERLAQGILPDMNLMHYNSGLVIFEWSSAIIVMLGGLAWLWHLGLLPVPLSVQRWWYVYWLNAAGTFPKNSTFSPRGLTTLPVNMQPLRNN